MFMVEWKINAAFAFTTYHILMCSFIFLCTDTLDSFVEVQTCRTMVLLYKEPIFSKQINFVVDVRMEQLLDVMKCNALSVYIGWNIYEICEIRLKFYQC